METLRKIRSLAVVPVFLAGSDALLGNRAETTTCNPLPARSDCLMTVSSEAPPQQSSRGSTLSQ
jgi:hypothetical protein